MNTGNTAFKSSNGLITTLACTLDDEAVQYALEGSVFVGGAVVQWLRDELKIIENSAESEILATNADADSGVYIVPAFSGLGAPYWDMRARGTICGLTRGSGKNEICRAALESIAYQTEDLLGAMRADTKLTLKTLNADGGATANRFLMQFQSDISDVTVKCPQSPEATALGAAFLAGLKSGFWQDREEIKSLIKYDREFVSKMDNKTREKLLDGWRRAVGAAKAFDGGDI